MSTVLDELSESIEPVPEIVSLFAGTRQSIVLGLDVGTSGVRAALFDESGRETSAARIDRSSSALSDFTELDPDSLVDEVIRAIDQLLTTTPVAGKIESIAISAFWHSLMGIDESGSPTTQLFTWADTRATEIARALRSELVEQDLHLRTGCRFHSSYWPAKLRWLRANDAVAWSRTHMWLGFAEYLCLRLFGEPVASISMASATGLLNQRTCNWDWEYVSQLEIEPTTLPPISDLFTRPLVSRFASRWPALTDAQLTTIVGDGAANNVGGGCTTKNELALMVGTSGAMRVVYDGDPPAQLPPSLWSYRVDRKRVVVGGALSDGGGLYRWLTQSLAVDTSELARELKSLEPDAHGLTILPFWSGERSTGWSGDARGAILGLTQQTTPVEIVRAGLEAIAYRFALIAKDLTSIAPDAGIVATGNALRSSPVWLQVIADVLGRPLMFGGFPEASIRGAALLALEGLGKITDIDAAVVSVDELFEPDLEHHARYEQAMKRQEHFYQKLIADEG